MTFKDISINSVFMFADPVEYSRGRQFQKVSARKYVELDTEEPVFEVGTTSIKVIKAALRGKTWHYDTNPASTVGTTLFSKLNTGDCFLYSGGYEHGYKQWRPEGEYQKLTPISAMTKHNHRIYQFPSDVLITPSYEVADNPSASASHTEEMPETVSQSAPPLYRLNYLDCIYAGGQPKRKYPAFPIQILPSEDSTVAFRFWSSGKYDVHFAFPGVALNGEKHYVIGVNYQIIYDKTAHHLVHRFERAKVCLALDGLHATKVIMKSYRELDDFPKLPADWTYFQFVN